MNPKSKEKFDLAPYTQVFGDKSGFLPKLSVVDLLFNEGPNSLSYLEEQDLESL